MIKYERWKKEKKEKQGGEEGEDNIVYVNNISFWDRETYLIALGFLFLPTVMWALKGKDWEKGKE